MTSAGGVTHTYDANGNTILIGVTNHLVYDYENRLTQTVFGQTNVYQYDGMGNRRQLIRDGVTNGFVLDVSRPLSQILATTDGSGSVTAYYVYGLGLMSKIEPSGATRYYHYDSRGSTVAITDSTGAMLNAYAYDPFGQVTVGSESADNKFRYLGRYGVVDEGNGLSYVRARYYSAARGRFLSKDPLTGRDGVGQSLNRYVYALNNPVGLIDISGFSAKEASGGTQLLATSDSSWLHNYLISPASGGLEAQSFGIDRVDRTSAQAGGVKSEVMKTLFNSFLSALPKVVRLYYEGWGTAATPSVSGAVMSVGPKTVEVVVELAIQQPKILQGVKDALALYVDFYLSGDYTLAEVTQLAYEQEGYLAKIGYQPDTIREMILREAGQ